MIVAYLDLIGGISGDMFLAALLDAGASSKTLKNFLENISPDLGIEVYKTQSKGFSGLHIKTRAKVFPPISQYQEMVKFLEKLSIPQEIKKKAQKIFTLLFASEARVHGKSLEEVHLHELAAYDTIIDILGVLMALKELKIKEIYTSPIPLALGKTHGAHGYIPLPAPATMELLKGFEIFGISEDQETVTPTGAALLKALAQPSLCPLMHFHSLGIGIGTHKFKSRPNILRIWIGEQEEKKDLSWEEIVELETYIDDQTPEVLARAAENLLASGALEVGFSPFYMKKGRPGLKMTLLTIPQKVTSLASLMLMETGSLGIRVREIKRLVIARKIEKKNTPWGPVRIKIASLGKQKWFKPEFEDIKNISQKTGEPIRILKEKIWAWLLKEKFF